MPSPLLGINTKAEIILISTPEGGSRVTMFSLPNARLSLVPRFHFKTFSLDQSKDQRRRDVNNFDSLQSSDGPRIGWRPNRRLIAISNQVQSNWHLCQSMQKYIRKRLICDTPRCLLAGLHNKCFSQESTTFDDGYCNI